MRKEPRPVLVEFKTFRMRGHEEASGTKYVPQELMDEWQAKDPVLNFENYLLEQKIISQDQILEIKDNILQEINEHLEMANSEAIVSADLET